MKIDEENKEQEINKIVSELLTRLSGMQYGEIGLLLKVHNSEIVSVDYSKKENVRVLLRG